jgi:hypothetical protein
MRWSSRAVRGLVLACHPGPTVVVTGLAAALAAGIGAAPATTLLLAAAVLAGQLSVGWSNDWLDAARDLAVARPGKPVVVGLLDAGALRTAAVVAATACVPLSLATGWLPGAVHLIAVASAWAYNLALKRTVLSWLPYAVSFGLLVQFVVLAHPRSPTTPRPRVRRCSASVRTQPTCCPTSRTTRRRVSAGCPIGSAAHGLPSWHSARSWRPSPSSSSPQPGSRLPLRGPAGEQRWCWRASARWPRERTRAAGCRSPPRWQSPSCASSCSSSRVPPSCADPRCAAGSLLLAQSEPRVEHREPLFETSVERTDHMAPVRDLDVCDLHPGCLGRCRHAPRARHVCRVVGRHGEDPDVLHRRAGARDGRSAASSVPPVGPHDRPSRTSRSGRRTADAGTGDGPRFQAFRRDGPPTGLADAVRAVGDPGCGCLDLVQVVLGLLDKSVHLRPLESDRRALRVVLVVGIRAVSSPSRRRVSSRSTASTRAT